MFALVFLLLISPAVGSFLAVLADRLPRGQDVVRAPSACRSCGTRLGLRDLIPVVSFALNAGRCRHCKASVPPWLLYMEILATGGAVVAVILAQNPAEAWGYALFLWLLLALIACDLLWFRLPDLLTGALLIVALGLAGHSGYPPLHMAIWGAVIGAGSFMALRLGYRALRGREGLGLGDVKLMAGLGAALGPYDIPVMTLVAALTGIAVAIAGRVRSPRATRPGRPLPFGAALAAATGVIWILVRMPV